MKNKHGSNGSKIKYHNWLGISKKAYNSVLWLILLFLLIFWVFYGLYKPQQLLSPVMEQYPSGVCGPCMKPSPMPEEQKTYKQKVLSYIVDKFGDDAPDAIVLLRKCENSAFSDKAVNVNRNGTKDFSIFQVNSVHIKKYGDGFVRNWQTNVDVAYDIFKSRGWDAWTCKWVI